MIKQKLSFIFLLGLISCSSTTGVTGTDSQFSSEKETIYSTLKNHYVGFDTMVERGFSEEVWDSVSNYDEIKILFDKCINDTHLYISNNNDFEYRQYQQFDEDSIRSNDPDKTFVKKTTSNTYYLRYNSCDINWKEYADLPNLADEASAYNFIVLDFRSNYGGGNNQQYQFFYNLNQKNYKGGFFG